MDYASSRRNSKSCRGAISGAQSSKECDLHAGSNRQSSLFGSCAVRSIGRNRRHSQGAVQRRNDDGKPLRPISLTLDCRRRYAEPQLAGSGEERGGKPGNRHAKIRICVMVAGGVALAAGVAILGRGPLRMGGVVKRPIRRAMAST